MKKWIETLEDALFLVRLFSQCARVAGGHGLFVTYADMIVSGSILHFRKDLESADVFFFHVGFCRCTISPGLTHFVWTIWRNGMNCGLRKLILEKGSTRTGL